MREGLASSLFTATEEVWRVRQVLPVPRDDHDD